MADHHPTTQKINSKKLLLESNPLHKFATYNTIFTLSGLRESEIQDQTFLTNPVHDIIARTGGIGNPNIKNYPERDPLDDVKIIRDKNKAFDSRYGDSVHILEAGHDIFFENVNILSTVGPNVERSLANFTRMEFELHEPFSITFIEKVRAATALNGYIDYQDAPLLLTIEWKGNSQGGRPGLYSNGENLTSGFTSDPIVRKIPILIVRVDFDVNEAGSKYNVIAVSYPDLAFDDRFKFPRVDIEVKAKDPREWAKKVEEKLNEAMIKERDIDHTRKVIDEYKFLIDDEVYKYGGDYKNIVSSTVHTADVEDTMLGTTVFVPTPNLKVKLSSGNVETTTSLVKFFEDAIRQTYGYQKLANEFWTAYLENAGIKDLPTDKKELNKFLNSSNMKEILTKNQWVPWFKIKTTVQTHTELKSDFDTITKMHKKTIIFRAISYKIHILKLLKPGVSLDVDFSKIVRKEYNYIYTGENVDVQSLRLHYKTAYYMRNVVGWNRSRATKGLVNTLTETWNQLFGQEKDPEPQLPLRQYPSVVLNRSTVDVASGEGGKAQEFFDYLTNPVADMMRIELEILGDPAYICQDIYTPLNGKGETGASTKTEFDEQLHSFNAEQFNPLIFVRYRMPDDIDEKEGTMFSKKKYRKENLFFNGAYQVVRVDSKFDNGQFLQTLTCVRFNNQSGEGLPPILVSSANKDVQWVPKKKIDNIIKKEPVISTDAYS